MFIDLLSESCEEGGISLLGNEDKPIFRGYVLPDQPEFLVIFILALFGKCTPGNYCDDYLTSHVHTLHIQAIYKHT